jgi:hypothetical protein
MSNHVEIEPEQVLARWKSLEQLIEVSAAGRLGSGEAWMMLAYFAGQAVQELQKLSTTVDVIQMSIAADRRI